MQMAYAIQWLILKPTWVARGFGYVSWWTGFVYGLVATVLLTMYAVR